MDNKRTIFDFNDRIIAGTPSIRVPEKMVFYTKKGKLREVDTLTKSGVPSMRNKKRTIEFVKIKDDEPLKIITPGYSHQNLKDRSTKIISAIGEKETENTYKAIRAYGDYYNYYKREIKRMNNLKRPNKKKIKEYEEYIKNAENNVEKIQNEGLLYKRPSNNFRNNKTENRTYDKNRYEFFVA